MGQYKNTDKDWEQIGKSDPYYGVLTFEQFHSAQENPITLKDFWKSGEVYVQEILEIVHDNISKNFKPKKVLDFGCGVGRILIPLCSKAEWVTGVDVSQGMIDEAQKNCERLQISNVDFIKGDYHFAKQSEKFDFIHSFIVFQHIPVKRGTKIFKELLTSLEEDGIGVIHFTYFRRARTFNNFAYYLIKNSVFLSGIWNIVHKKSFSDPVMQMNLYDLNKIFQFLQAAGCHRICVRFTNHGEKYFGVLLIFQKKNNLISGV